MSTEDLREDLCAIMRIIHDRGGTHCSGTCHHRKPGEFHCHLLSQELKISSSGVKERILELVRMGLLDRKKVQRPGTFPVIRFTVSEKGRAVLDSCGRHPLEQGASS